MDDSKSVIQRSQLSEFLEITKTLQMASFYGTITFEWQNGVIVLMRKDETYKPKDFFNIVITKVN